MGIALHPYLVGQPYRLRHLRRALRHIAGRADDSVWITTAAAIALLRVITQRIPDLGFRLRRTDPLWGLAAFLAALPVILLTSNVAGILDTLIAGEPPFFPKWDSICERSVI